MSFPSDHQHRCRGFTLIEIMVVLVIIGIVLAVAIPNLFVAEDERVRQHAERITTVLEQTRDDAAMRGRVVAVRFTKDGIEFAQRDPDATNVRWRAIEGATMAWKDSVRAVTVTSAPTPTATPARNEGEPLRSDDILFVPNGVSKPFEVLVYAESDPSVRRTIIGDAVGNVSIK